MKTANRFELEVCITGKSKRNDVTFMAQTMIFLSANFAFVWIKALQPSPFRR